jgi:hypothetical protein
MSRRPPAPQNPQALEKLHERSGNTNVMQITEGKGGFAAIWGGRSRVKGTATDAVKHHYYQGNWCGRRVTAGGKNMSMRLPDFLLQVKGLFVAVPQIEHNWTPHRPVPHQT